MKFSIHTLGCKVNQYESEVVAEALEKKGYERASHGEKCDICFINTCAVTEESVRKSLQIIRRAKRLNPDAIIISAGCASQSEDHRARLEEVCDITLGNKNKPQIPDLIEKFVAEKEKISSFVKIGEEKDFEPMTAYTGERTRATLKVQDGCNNFCSYCIIPYVRGRIRSKDFDEAVSEMKFLAKKSGYKEIVLTGIHLDNYGKDIGNVTLMDLLEAAENIDGLERIRLSSLEPVFITEENVERMKKLTKICHHFHLSLQSGCDETLKRMNRHYTTEEYAHCVKLLREAFDDTAITTDIIVGFPGETEEEFQTTMKFAEDIGFMKIHIFPFSERQGTAAAKMEGKLKTEVKNDRVHRLNSIATETRKNFLKEQVGKAVTVLFETEKDGKLHGYTPNYVEVVAEGPKELCNKTAKVCIYNAEEEFVYGKIK
ncbi:MAG: tRNA (N(6)-L-threonylcarbamoyladenosine(37)-C(2))-methylthiotransferase MtaB [Clostridia bacterium]|nr:tRNA (N(6)-L-threonylcarbamoyladenosine(37)-C(2))-methylthiotransferase MtaB [Clostridia bacterium]